MNSLKIIHTREKHKKKKGRRARHGEDGNLAENRGKQESIHKGRRGDSREEQVMTETTGSEDT